MNAAFRSNNVVSFYARRCFISVYAYLCVRLSVLVNKKFQT